jgi:hypothetical protein
MDTANFITKLQKARALVARGWTQGKFRERRSGRTCYCPLGAILRAGLPTSVFDMGPVPHENIVAWNDDPSRTKAEVLAMFDNSIAALTKR